MARSDIKNEIDGVLDFFEYEYCLSKKEATKPALQMYVYLYLDGSIDDDDFIQALTELKSKQS